MSEGTDAARASITDASIWAAPAFTPGPWAWFGSAYNQRLYLATPHSGRRIVMDFARWGMRGAQPRFQRDGRLVPGEEFLCFEVGDDSVRGVSQAKANDSVYRLDIRDVDHPDARLIAAAPEMFEALQAQHNAIDILLARLIELDPSFRPSKSVVWPMLLQGNAALLKATGGQS